MDASKRVVTCKFCKKVNEFDNPVTRPSTGLNVEYGFTCAKCGRWEHMYFINPQLLDKARALSKLRPGSLKYNKALLKFRQRFDTLQRELRGNYGTRSNTNMAST